MTTTTRVEIEVAPDAMQQAIDVLRRLPGVRHAVAEGETITVQGPGRDSIPGLIQALAAAHVPIYRVTPREPSLEDIYFALHGETSRHVAGTPSP
jgi:ABC-2 type transport system ATP-binding protein